MHKAASASQAQRASDKIEVTRRCIDRAGRDRSAVQIDVSRIPDLERVRDINQSVARDIQCAGSSRGDIAATDDLVHRDSGWLAGGVVIVLGVIDKDVELGDIGGQEGEVELPVFDKGLDDQSGTRRIRGPYDVVLLEGWCVGAEAATEASLVDPINELERERDADCTWRRYVNAQLAGDYSQTWDALDYLVYLRVPDLAAVRRWRLQQESSRPADQRLDSDAVDRFVQHYERITRSMMASLPDRADLTIDLAEDHSIATMAFRSS